MQARAIFFTGVNQVAVDTITIPDPGPGEVLIEAAYTCISPGTELRCLAGQQPNAAAWPFVPGYALAGRVIARGAGATLAVGAPVFCGGARGTDRNLMWGGHVSHATRHESEVFLVPEGVNLLDAVITKLAAITYHGVRLTRPLPHEKVAVVGLGPIGQLSARLHAIAGAHVLGIDLSPERVALAQQAGVDAIVPQGSLADAARQIFPEGADIVVDATGAPAVLPQALKIARDLDWTDTVAPGARFVVQGSYPGDFALPYQEAFQKEVTVLIPRDTQPRDLRAALDLMRRGKLHARDLISDVRPPERAAEAYAELQAAKGGMMTVAFGWV
jgi:3-hydroxyethyl bacteriochlorophyllide a dehydrogenase